MPWAIIGLALKGGTQLAAEFEQACRGRPPAAVRAPAALAETERGGRARPADPHRGVLSGCRQLLAPARAQPRAAPVGTDLQHRAPAPSPGLSDPAAVSAALAIPTKGVKSVTNLLDEYTHLKNTASSCMLASSRNAGSANWETVRSEITPPRHPKPASESKSGGVSPCFTKHLKITSTMTSKRAPFAASSALCRAMTSTARTSSRHFRTAIGTTTSARPSSAAASATNVANCPRRLRKHRV